MVVCIGLKELTTVKNALSTRGVVMPTKPTPQRVYPAENGQSVIVCPQCMKHTPIDASPYMYSHKSLKVGCQCGHKFPVVFDTRKFYRKELCLPGQYTKLSTDALGHLANVGRGKLALAFIWGGIRQGHHASLANSAPGS
jgi:hypothetical protein